MTTPDGMLAVGPSDDAARIQWPHRLRELVAAWFGGKGDASAAASRDQVWILLYGVVAAYARGRARSSPSIRPEDLRDLAAEKALDLMRQLDARAWDPSRAAPEQVRAYVALAVRHAIADFARLGDTRLVEAAPDTAPEPAALPSQPDTIDGKSYAAAILACLSRLTARNRAAWCLRILLEMTSDQIARHPSVRMRPGAVDVMLFRVRGAMRRCLADSGVDTASMPAGTYVHLWEAIEGGEP